MFKYVFINFELLNYNQIIKEIDTHVKRAGLLYSAWTIGVTDDPTERRRQHRNPPIWHQWNADTETTARNVETYFKSKGMKGGTGGLGNADFVYIF